MADKRSISLVSTAIAIILMSMMIVLSIISDTNTWWWKMIIITLAIMIIFNAVRTEINIQRQLDDFR